MRGRRELLCSSHRSGRVISPSVVLILNFLKSIYSYMNISCSLCWTSFSREGRDFIHIKARPSSAACILILTLIHMERLAEIQLFLFLFFVAYSHNHCFLCNIHESCCTEVEIKGGNVISGLLYQKTVLFIY